MCGDDPQSPPVYHTCRPAVPDWGILGAMNAAYRQLLETFGRGWGAGDVDGILSVFAPDAVFLETPFSEQSVGIDAIRAYWTWARRCFRSSTRINSAGSTSASVFPRRASSRRRTRQPRKSRRLRVRSASGRKPSSNRRYRRQQPTQCRLYQEWQHFLLDRGEDSGRQHLL